VRPNTIDFFGSRVISGRVGSGQVLGSYEFRSFWASGHSSRGQVGFWVI
jgi:hypothetical protein